MRKCLLLFLRLAPFSFLFLFPDTQSSSCPVMKTTTTWLYIETYIFTMVTIIVLRNIKFLHCWMIKYGRGFGQGILGFPPTFICFFFFRSVPFTKLFVYHRGTFSLQMLIYFSQVRQAVCMTMWKYLTAKGQTTQAWVDSVETPNPPLCVLQLMFCWWGSSQISL